LETGVNIVIPAYSKVAATVSQAGDTPVGKLVGSVLQRGGSVIDLVRGHDGPEAAAAPSRSAAPARKRSTARKPKTARPSEGRSGTGSPRSHRAASEAAVEVKVPAAPDPVATNDLPLIGYDSLVAEEIVKRLDGLTQTELAVLYKYERAHDSRSTVLEAIDGKMVELPLPTYDSLLIPAILDDLNGLTRGELATIREYEVRTNNRLPILERIDELLAVQV
ncbi:MAG TPA: hypothetical protein VFS18_03705, partial [Actinomycetota bacterium]|nr:hypothetical protein [Actinomycetota bacterium]